MCLNCNETEVYIFKEYNLKRHYTSKHGTKYDKFQGNSRKKKVEELNKNLSRIRARFGAIQIIAEEEKLFIDGNEEMLEI